MGDGPEDSIETTMNRPPSEELNRLIINGLASRELHKRPSKDEKDPEFAAAYPDRYWGNFPDGSKLDIQITDPAQEVTTILDLGSGEKKYKLLGRVWKTQKGEKNYAKCYKLILDDKGKQKWVVETTTKEPRYDEETNKNYWKIDNPRDADEAEIVELTTVMENVFASAD